MRYERSFNAFRYTYNYDLYPTDIQKMIDNNDSRYAYRWCKDNYMEI